MKVTSLNIPNARAAALAGMPLYALDNARKRHGEYLGVKPIKASNGRIYWPRREFMEAVGRKSNGAPKTLPANAAHSYFPSLGLDLYDPLVAQVVQALLALENPPTLPASDMLDQVEFAAQVLEALLSRLYGDARMSQRERDAAERYLERRLAGLDFHRPVLNEEAAQ